MWALDIPAAIRKHEKEQFDFVAINYRLFVSGDTDRSRYVRTVALKYSARTDLQTNFTVLCQFKCRK